MKVYLDDERTAPPGWIQVRWPKEIIELIKQGGVEIVSLDHDLADPLVTKERTGYDVLLWIEERVATTDFVPPIIYIHTANCSAKKKMQAALKNIKRLLEERDG
jgi:hypothetical protein